MQQESRNHAEKHTADAPICGDTQEMAELFRFLGYAIAFEPDGTFMNIVLSENLFADPLPTDEPTKPNNAGNTAWRADFDEGLRLVRDWSARHQLDSLNELIEDAKCDWLKLFVGSGTPIAPPWESVYTDKDHIMFAESNLDVRAAYRRHGLKTQLEGREPDDNLGLMFEFMAILAEREAAANAAEAKQYQAQQIEFAEAHMLSFIDAWARDIVEKGPSTLYSGIALMAKGALNARIQQLTYQ